MTTASKDTNSIYTAFAEEADKLLGEDRIAQIKDIPHITSDEITYVKAINALALSTQQLTSAPEQIEANKAFRYFAKLAIRKASKKITDKNRKLELLHIVCCGSPFEHRHLPHFLLALIEEDE